MNCCPLCNNELTVTRNRDYKGHEWFDKDYIVVCNTCGITAIGLDEKVLDLFEKTQPCSSAELEAAMLVFYEAGRSASKDEDYKRPDYKS